MMTITRKHHLARVRLLLDEFPVVALLGARQVGKTTLARQLAAAHRDPVRCKPSFALSVLERMKHVFSANGVCFVLVAGKSEEEPRWSSRMHPGQVLPDICRHIDLFWHEGGV